MQIKVIASSIEPLPLTTDANLGFVGLAGITNEDPEVDVYCRHVGANVTPASVMEIVRGGTMLAHAFGMQYQVQNMSTGNIPSEYWIAATPFGPMPGDTIAARVYCASPQNDVATLVTSSFTVPSLNSNVQIDVLDTSGFSVGTFVNNAANAGVFCGGRFWDIVSVDSATQMTLKLRDAFGAVVTMIG
jgi:hypothetical protein